MKIGLIGLGNIGVHFGTRMLAAGHELLVHDRSDAMQQRLVAKVANGMPSAKALALATVRALTLVNCRTADTRRQRAFHRADGRASRLRNAAN